MKASEKKTTRCGVKASQLPATKKNAAADKISKPKNKRVVLTVKAEPGSTVYLAGSFNNWNPTSKKLADKNNDGIFSAVITLPPGIYEYKFVINGNWTLDPDPERDWTQNGLGTLNSVLRVG